MKDKQFDRIIKEKLEGIQPNLDPFSWDRFEQQLDQADAGTPEAEDRMVDQVVFEKLHKLEVPYQPQHWRQLSARLENAFQLEYMLIRYKLMELAFLLLLLLVGFNGITPPASAPPTPPPQLTPALEKADKPAQAILSPAAQENKTSSLQTNKMLPPPNEQAPSPTGESNGETAAALLADADLPSPAKGAVLNASPLIPSSQKRRLLPALPFVAPQLQLEAQKEKWQNLPRIGRLEMGLLAYNPDFHLPVKLLATPSRHQMMVSMFGGPDYNRVRTPSDTLSNGEFAGALDRYALGYNGGITLGFELGRWEIESGAIYSAKVYRPRQVLYLLGTVKSGYYGEGVRDIELNTLQIPVNVRYHVLRHKNWRAYALAGFSLQVAFQANYYVADQNGFDDVPFLAPPGEGFQPTQESSLDRKNLGGGWFEGGRFEDNAYITGNLGFGVERYLSPRWSVFSQPTYQHSLDYFIQGLGPDKDRINTFSIFMGVRVRL